MRLWT